jgi:uncharacterized protein involved in exopolysaccharide biosynthesis
VGGAVVLFWPPSYRADGTLILKGSHTLQSQGNLSDAQTKVELRSEEELYSEREILLSRDVVRSTVAQLLSEGQLGTGGSASDAVLNKLVDRVQNALAASVVPQSNLIEASVTWPDPGTAQSLLSTLFKQYTERRQDVFNPGEAAAFFKGQLESSRQRLEELEARLLEATGGSSVEDLQDQIDQNRALQADLRKELNALESERVEKKEYVDYLEKSLKDEDYNFFTAIDNLELGGLAKRIVEVLIEREEQLKTYEKGSPPVQRSQEQFDRLYKVFRAEVKRFAEHERQLLEAVETQIDSVQRRLAELRQEAEQRYRHLIEARRLSRERAVMEDSYTSFAKRFRDAEIRNETNSDSLFNVGVVQPAYAGSGPVFPNAGRVIPISLLLGVLFGVTLGFVSEFFDHRVKRPEDIQNYTDLGYLYSVPAYS